jgi:23S rRNA (cytosine1962-C5)-methyltransferase
MTVPRVVLRSRRARPFFARHPWVFAGAIADVQGEPADGDIVDLVSSTGEFIARGLYNSHSNIRVRLYSWSQDVPLDRNFWRSRLSAALRLRHDILRLNGPARAYRLVFSEGDGLPGLTVDRYDRWLVMQVTALGLAQRRQELVEILVELLEPDGIYLRTERGMSELEGIEQQDGLLWGSVPSEPIRVEENGLHFLVDLTQGQKTGFYTDQRDNRQRVAQFAAGRRVLDAFCYTGGFGLYAARAPSSGPGPRRRRSVPYASNSSLISQPDASWRPCPFQHAQKVKIALFSNRKIKN